MKIGKFHHCVIAIAIISTLFLAAAVSAKVAGTLMHTAEGRVTAINIQQGKISVNGEPYIIEGNGRLLDTLKSNDIQVSEKVVVIYEVMGGARKLISINKKADRAK
ncbi:hypothetical protein [Desulfosarcina ovata]|uniref:DUF5666 domain-containing protein n=2 Tax=Desulfosarcina ovata TaxID=83564 RepID=A0A5K8AKN1_9BACT|nr:hypothetical protein [Desulfosarcina ovata]BBO86331.1 hypothetical protein DSCO28_68970 [Desulfosarcina ovata subsp. sediminis]BBO93272.1 hypothetical protein DSCOOX_64520 [Desulfosarcina ovata subsp. ovata]